MSDDGKIAPGVVSAASAMGQTEGGNGTGGDSSEDAAKVAATKPVVCIVMGMAGSGKTTLLQRLHLHTLEKGIRSYFINLDPAVKQVQC